MNGSEKGTPAEDPEIFPGDSESEETAVIEKLMEATEAELLNQAASGEITGTTGEGLESTAGEILGATDGELESTAEDIIKATEKVLESTARDELDTTGDVIEATRKVPEATGSEATGENLQQVTNENVLEATEEVLEVMKSTRNTLLSLLKKQPDPSTILPPPPPVAAATAVPIISVPRFLVIPPSFLPIIINTTDTYTLAYGDTAPRLSLAVQILTVAAQNGGFLARVVGVGPLSGAGGAGPRCAYLTGREEVQLAMATAVDSRCSGELRIPEKDQITEDDPIMEDLPRRAPLSPISTEEDRECWLTFLHALRGRVVSGSTIEFTIDDLLFTCPFTQHPRMIGGTSVEFDLAVNPGKRKVRGKRVKEVVEAGEQTGNIHPRAKRKSTSETPTDRISELPELEPLPTTFDKKGLLKAGLVGLMVCPPSRLHEGEINLYVGDKVCRVLCKEVDALTPGVIVTFTLHLKFDGSLLAFDVKATAGELGRYEVANFLLPTPRCQKGWSPTNFSWLITIIGENKARALRSFGKEPMLTDLGKWKYQATQFVQTLTQEYYRAVDAERREKEGREQGPEKSGKSAENGGKSAENGEKKDDKKKYDVRNMLAHIVSQYLKERGQLTPSQPAPLPAEPTAKFKPRKRVRRQQKPSASLGPDPGQTESEHVETPTELDKALKKVHRPNHLPYPQHLPRNNSLVNRYNFIGKNLTRWKMVPEVPGEQEMNSVLGEVMSACGQSPIARESGDAQSSSTSPDGAVDYGSIYRYLGALLGGKTDQLRDLDDMEKRVVCALFSDLLSDISKRNLHTHKQFLLQRYFDFTGSKTAGRTPTNPFKLKGNLLHLTD